MLISIHFDLRIALKGVQRPAAFAIVCFCFCEFRTVSYSGSCGEHDADFTQSMLVFVLPLISYQHRIFSVKISFLVFLLFAESAKALIAVSYANFICLLVIHFKKLTMASKIAKS